MSEVELTAAEVCRQVRRVSEGLCAASSSPVSDETARKIRHGLLAALASLVEAEKALRADQGVAEADVSGNLPARGGAEHRTIGDSVASGDGRVA
ncbi:MAG: hypothetical protein AAGI53_09405 [Planctomycetota bacterium]